MPQVEIKKYEKDNVRYVEDVCPEGFTEVDVYHPCSSITPWDYHGGKHQREYMRVLEERGLHPLALETRNTIIHPVGTGPRGSVRFGDDMLPHVYRIAVPSDEAGAAAEAITDHKEAIKKWLDREGPMPTAVG